MQLLITLTCLVNICYGQAANIEYGNNPDAGHYTDVNGINMYYVKYMVRVNHYF